MKKKKFSVGLIFIRWNIHNRVCIGVCFFKDGQFVKLKISRKLIENILQNFMSTSPISLSFIQEHTDGMKRIKVSEKEWNHQAIQQNGILEIHKTNPIAIVTYTDELINKYSKIFLKK